MTALKFGFLGGGQMATAIAKGAIQSGIATDAEIAFCETNSQQIDILRVKFPMCTLVTSPHELFEICSRIILAVKPPTLLEIASNLVAKVTPAHLLVSIAAGISALWGPLHGGANQAVIEMLEKKGHAEAVIIGGEMTISYFLNSGLVDDIYFVIEPVLFGSGLLFFKNKKLDFKLNLLEVTKLNTDTVQLHYKIQK